MDTTSSPIVQDGLVLHIRVLHIMYSTDTAARHLSHAAIEAIANHLDIPKGYLYRDIQFCERSINTVAHPMGIHFALQNDTTDLKRLFTYRSVKMVPTADSRTDLLDSLLI